MELPFNINLDNKVVVITGAGGIICSYLAKAIAKCGAKVCLLDLNLESASAFANEIVSDGYIAKGYACNVLDKASIEKCHEEILKDFGTYDIRHELFEK